MDLGCCFLCHWSFNLHQLD